jgi:hypothetical protein
MVSDRWTKIHTVDNIFEMDSFKAALDKEGIEYIAKEHKDTAYDGLFVLQKGYATFYVREEDEPAVKGIIKGLTILTHVVLPED